MPTEPDMQPQPDYMATPEELAKQPTAQRLIELAAGGDNAVYAFAWAFWNFAHAWDDLIDESGWTVERKARAWKALHDFTTDLLVNP